MTRVSRRYALAFFRVVKERDLFEVVARDFRHLSLLIENPDFKAFLLNHLVTHKEAQDVIGTLSQRLSLEGLTRDFLSFLSQNKRLRAFPKIVEEFFRLYEEERNVVRARVVSAHPLAEKQLDVLKKTFQEKINKTIELTTLVDEKLLGGFMITIGPYLVDFSLSSRLNRMQTLLRGK